MRRVPGSKEEVFKDQSVGLMEKRRLMKFLMFAGGEFENDPILAGMHIVVHPIVRADRKAGRETQPLPVFLEEAFHLPNTLAQSITYAIAHCSSPAVPILPALVRTRRYLRSVGRYGAGAFLVGQYGGAGEVAQGFCRCVGRLHGTTMLT